MNKTYALKLPHTIWDDDKIDAYLSHWLDFGILLSLEKSSIEKSHERRDAYSGGH